MPLNNFTGLTGTGWIGQIGSTGLDFARRFAIFDTVEHGIEAALDNLVRLYQGLTLRQIISKWLTGNPYATVDPTHPQYTVADYLRHADQIISGLGGQYDPDALAFRDGGWIGEPVIGRGVRTGTIHTFNEDGRGELVLNREQVGALAGRGERERVVVHAKIDINVEHGNPREIKRAVKEAMRELEDEWVAP